LVGYFSAAAFVGYPHYGRKRMMGVGFLMMSLLFLVCGAAFGPLTSTTAGLHAFQALYMLSSFWNQFGPNCTTWLVAGEEEAGLRALDRLKGMVEGIVLC
jgi:hypothetical protein